VSDWGRRVELSHLPFKLSYSQLKHLVLSHQHLRLRLIESAFIPIARRAPEQELVAFVMAAER